MSADQDGRNGQCYVAHKRHDRVKQPILQLRPVGTLTLHASSHNDCINDPDESEQTPKDGGRRNGIPGSSHDAGEQKHGPEVNHGRRGEGAAGLLRTLSHRYVGDERDHHKLQTD